MKYRYNATFKMDRGDIVFRLYEDAPIQLHRFWWNAHNGLFKGISFDRVIPGFMVQSGPLPNPDGSNHNYMLDEVKPPQRKRDNNFHAYGVLSAANAGSPNSSMGGFFICLSRVGTRHLDSGHTTFGHVIEGMELIEQIEKGDIVHNIIITES
jgi:peptidyl-prolyl cis-trans isomerase B (cyclophilin B)